MFLEQASANLNNLKPLDIIKPVNPEDTVQEWQEIFAAQKPSPEFNPINKKGTVPQPGKDLLHTFE
jgi:hypothetical protein